MVNQRLDSVHVESEVEGQRLVVHVDKRVCGKSET